MINVLRRQTVTTFHSVAATVIYSLTALFALVWTIACAAIFFQAIYEGHTGGPALVVAPVYAAFGVYLLIELGKAIRDAWR